MVKRVNVTYFVYKLILILSLCLEVSKQRLLVCSQKLIHQMIISPTIGSYQEDPSRPY